MNKDLQNSLEIGTVLDNKWVILEFIGRGGMGEVYRAHQLNLKRDVAIKVISREWLESLEGDEEELLSGIQRFKNEMHAMAQVRHPNVISIFDQGSIIVQGPNGQMPLEYIAMEFIPGGSLRATMSDEGFYPEEGLVREWVRDYFLPILDGLEALHQAGIIHRDIKPENILLDRNSPKITDFGLAHSHALQPLTCSADMKGTPAYMPPEQFLDFRRTDERTDIYALGKILYEAVDGRIKSNTIPFKQAKLKKTESPFFKNLDTIIRDATEEEKEKRFESIKELRQALLQVITPAAQGEPGKQAIASSEKFSLVSGANRKWFYVSLLVVLVILSLVAAWYMWLSRRQMPISSHVPPTNPAETKIGPNASQKSFTVGSKNTGPIPKTIVAEDGASLHLVPGGTVYIPSDSGSAEGTQITVESFYMDETPVTNHQYVDFLNQLLPELQVERNVVKKDGKIWLFLGEVLEGYEPIIYRNGRFHINKPAHAACPVVRVTAYGAAAYAKFYGRRLPTVDEWLYALIKGGLSVEQQSRPPQPQSYTWDSQEREPWNDMGGMMEMMHSPTQQTTTTKPPRAEPPHFPSPVLNYEPNGLGIRGLNENIGEWGTEQPTAKDAQTEEAFAVLGGLGSHSKEKSVIPRPILRKPWEAFEEVSFRTVINTPIGN